MRVLTIVAAVVALFSSAIASLGTSTRPLIADGTACTTGGLWNQNGLMQGGSCRPFHVLIKGVDDKDGGDGLTWQIVNQWQDVCQDNVSDGPVYASPTAQASSHSWFDATYHTSLGTGCKSLAYTNEEIMVDNKNELGLNTGGSLSSPGVCVPQNNKRDTAFLTYIKLHHGAESSPSPPSTQDDVVHAVPGPALPSISAGDGDSGRITGASTICEQSPSPEVTVQKYMMNPQADDIIGMAQDYMRGVLGSKVPFIDSGFTWSSATPSSGASNPNGSGYATCSYDTTKLGAFSCYDIFFLDQAAPHYDRGQSGGSWTGSFELDPSPGPTGIWDWTDSYPGVVAAELVFANNVKHPTGTGDGDTGAAFPLWLNGFATFNGGIRSDDSTTGAAVESCNSDELGQNSLGSNQGTAANILAGSIENAWIDGGTQVPLSVVWAVNMNCASDIYSESSPTPVFAAIGGHSTAFDTPQDGYDLDTTATTTVSPAPSPQAITVGSTLLNGAQIGHHNPFALLVGNTGTLEIVSVVDSTSSTITAVFTKNHGSSYKVRSLSPYSYRITDYALTMLAYTEGRTVAQMKFGTSHLDLPVYAEALIYPGSPVTTMGQFQGNPVFTTIPNAITSTGTLVPVTVTSARNIQPGQTLNLFNSDQTSWESVSVHAVSHGTKVVTLDSVMHAHTANAILRGTQAYDGCQMMNGTPIVDASTTGGIADYLISGTCGDDGTSLHRAGGVYCREFTALTVYAGSTMNGAACVNMTNKKVSFKVLLATGQGGSCTGSYCLTHAYTHICGAINQTDDGCLSETPPASTTTVVSITGGSSPQTFQVMGTTNFHVPGTYMLIGSDLTNLELITVSAILSSPSRVTAVVLKDHDSGVTLR